MLIGFLGDTHGCIRHALAVVLGWQRRSGKTLEAIFQLGDLGTLPIPGSDERHPDRFAEIMPARWDLWEMFPARGKDADIFRMIRNQLAGPIYFIRGNHDEQPLLIEKLNPAPTSPIPIDPFDLFHLIPNGFRLEIGGYEIGFLEFEDDADDFSGNDAFRNPAVSVVAGVDVLVSHIGPFGLLSNTLEVKGSRDALAFIKQEEPRYHVYAHNHTMHGPERIHKTACYMVASTVADLRRPVPQIVKKGCLGILDLKSNEFAFVQDEWLSEFGKSIDCHSIMAY